MEISEVNNGSGERRRISCSSIGAVEESFCMTFICAVPGLTHTSSAVDAGTKNEEDVLDP
jgi:hypothetical protein